MSTPCMDYVAFVNGGPFILQDLYRQRGATVVDLGLNHSLFRRGAFRAGIKTRMMFQLEMLRGKRLVVLAESMAVHRFAAWYAKMLPESRVIIWINNTIKDARPFIEASKEVDVYTFDPADAQHLGLKYRPQFYPLQPVVEREAVPHSAFFLGIDKGRCQQLATLNQCLAGLGWQCDFRVLADDMSDSCSELEYWSGGPIGYTEQLRLGASCEVIVDIVKRGQTGLSLRTLEAMAARRKVITNSEGVREFDFYDSSNIFICGECLDTSRLETFLASPTNDEAFNAVTHYDISCWAASILEDGESH